MSNYLISKKAVSDLEEIWEYTATTWSEEQAVKYYNSFYSAFTFISEQPRPIGQSYYMIKKGLWGYHIGRHIIFYRKRSDGVIAIVRILHEMMDLPMQLSD